MISYVYCAVKTVFLPLLPSTAVLSSTSSPDNLNLFSVSVEGLSYWELKHSCKATKIPLQQKQEGHRLGGYPPRESHIRIYTYTLEYKPFIISHITKNNFFLSEVVSSWLPLIFWHQESSISSLMYVCSVLTKIMYHFLILINNCHMQSTLSYNQYKNFYSLLAN